jgi:hypothetical protein
MGLIARLIGKAASTELGRKVIGKVAHGAKSVIGKLEKGYSWAKRNAPEIVAAGEEALHELGYAKDAKTAYKAAKDLADLGIDYGEGNVQNEEIPERLKSIAVKRIREY